MPKILTLLSTTSISTFIVLIRSYKLSGHTTSYDKVEFFAIMKILAGGPFFEKKKISKSYNFFESNFLKRL